MSEVWEGPGDGWYPCDDEAVSPCPWCHGNDDYEPFDGEDAARVLCRGHEAEYHGLSLDGLDRMEAGERADMADLGYYD